MNTTDNHIGVKICLSLGLYSDSKMETDINIKRMTMHLIKTNKQKYEITSLCYGMFCNFS